MNNDIIHKLEDIAIKMNNQHDRLERLLFGVELNLITCNKIEPEKNNATFGLHTESIVRNLYFSIPYHKYIKIP